MRVKSKVKRETASPPLERKVPKIALCEFRQGQSVPDSRLGTVIIFFTAAPLDLTPQENASFSPLAEGTAGDGAPLLRKRASPPAFSSTYHARIKIIPLEI